MRTKTWHLGAILGVALLILAVSDVPSGRAAETTSESSSEAWLGVYSQTLTPELRDEFKYQGDGALVNRVIPGSPAEKAGIKKGDVIISVNSRPVASAEELTRAIRSGRVDQSASIQVARDGVKKTLTAKLAARPSDEEFEESELGEHGEHGDFDSEDHEFSFRMPEGAMSVFHMGRGRLGIRVDDLNTDLGGYFGIKDGKGALVLEVLKDTPAERAGLKAGDVITKVGDRAIESSEDLRSALRSKEGKITLTVLRHGTRSTKEADIGATPRSMRFGPGEGMMGFRDGDQILRELRIRGHEGDQDLRRQMREMQDELKELRKQMEGLKRN